MGCGAFPACWTTIAVTKGWKSIQNSTELLNEEVTFEKNNHIFITMTHKEVGQTFVGSSNIECVQQLQAAQSRLQQLQTRKHSSIFALNFQGQHQISHTDDGCRS